jgi:hypothetical protein
MNRRVLVIEKWLLENLKNKAYERYDDLHIDQIDDAWKSRDSWIEGGLEAFRMAVELRDRHDLNFVVALAYSLIANEEPHGMDFRTTEELRARLDYSPPSLYLFQEGRSPRTETTILDGKVVAENISIKDVDPNILGIHFHAKSCYYMEFKQTRFSEYSRSLIIEG